MSTIVVVKLSELFCNLVSRIPVSIPFCHNYEKLIFIDCVRLVFVKLLHNVSDIAIIWFLPQSCHCYSELSKINLARAVSVEQIKSVFYLFLNFRCDLVLFARLTQLSLAD